MGDDITIGVTEIVNNIEVTAQQNDQQIDISVIDNADEVTLNVTPTVVEVNINRGSSYARWGTIYGTLGDQTDLANALLLKADLVGGLVPAYQLPSYVDDVVEVANYADLPTVGETGKIYVTLDNNKIYRWSGSIYIEIAANNSVWGAITGTLADQTDLQTALNLKANDNAVVKLTGDQTIANSKTFSGDIRPNLTLLKHNTNLGTITGHTSFGGVENGISIRIQGNQLANLLLTNITSPQNFELPDVSGTIALLSHVALKQDTLVSGDNIKTINGNSLLGSGNLTITASTGSLEFNGTDLTVWNNGKGNVTSNTSFGDGALKSNTTGSNNTSVGYNSLFSNTTGTFNTAFGDGSLYDNTTGNSNTAIGISSLSDNTTGGANTAVGINSLALNTTASNNTGIGTLALSHLTTGAGNTGIGTAAGRFITNGINANATGSNSVFLGYNTKAAADGETNQIVIGYTAIGNGSNSVTLGNTDITKTILRGKVGVGTISPATALDVNGVISITAAAPYIQWKNTSNTRLGYIQHNATDLLINADTGAIGFSNSGGERMRIASGGDIFIGRTAFWTLVGDSKGLGLLQNGAFYSVVENDNAGLFSRRSSNGDLILFRRDATTVGSISVTTTLTSYNVTSDYRLKQDFKPFNGLNIVSKIKVYDYEWKADNSRMNGVIAHELQEVIPYAVTGEKDGKSMQQVDYSKLVPILVQAIQELKAEIEILKNK